MRKILAGIKIWQWVLAWCWRWNDKRRSWVVWTLCHMMMVGWSVNFFCCDCCLSWSCCSNLKATRVLGWGADVPEMLKINLLKSHLGSTSLNSSLVLSSASISNNWMTIWLQPHSQNITLIKCLKGPVEIRICETNQPTQRFQRRFCIFFMILLLRTILLNKTSPSSSSSKLVATKLPSLIPPTWMRTAFYKRSVIFFTEHYLQHFEIFK